MGSGHPSGTGLVAAMVTMLSAPLPTQQVQFSILFRDGSLASGQWEEGTFLANPGMQTLVMTSCSIETVQVGELSTPS